MAKVGYLTVETTGTFAFHRGDGSLVEVKGNKPYETDDSGEIAYLDTVRFVKRAGKAKASGEEE